MTNLSFSRIQTRIALGGIAFIAAAAVAVAVSFGNPALGGVEENVGHTITQEVVASTFESPISASNPLASVGEKITEYAANTESVDSTTTKRLIKKAGVTNKTVLHSGESLDLSHAFTRETNNGSQVLRIPFSAKDNLLDISGFTVMFNPDGTIAARGEVVYLQQSEHSGRVALWQEGKLVTDQVVTDGITPDSMDTKIHAAFNWDTLNKCLLNAGIAQWALIAIGIACGLLCGATLGIGCVACVVAAGGVLGTTAGTCVAKAMIS